MCAQLILSWSTHAPPPGFESISYDPGAIRGLLNSSLLFDVPGG